MVEEDQIIELQTLSGKVDFIYHNSILREKGSYSEEQRQSQECFDYKWKKKESYDNEYVWDNLCKWLKEKYFGNDEMLLESIFKKGSDVLDVGCGSGMSIIALLGDKLNKVNYVGVDISGAVDVAKELFVQHGIKGEFLQCNLNNLPYEAEAFDVIFYEGVLHHTDSTEGAIKQLAPLLKKSGKFLFYVYAQKGPIREFADDHIRNYLKDKTNDESWEELLSLTKLGGALGDLNGTVNVPEDIPYLGIQKGPMDLQRLFYWNIMKMFYHPKYSIEEMKHINFDWYRPSNAHRQTPEQVRTWCEECGLIIERLCIEEAGITVIATKPE